MFQLFVGFFKNCFLEVRARSLTLALEQNITVLFSVRTIQCCILLTVHAKHVPFKNKLVKTVFFSSLEVDENCRKTPFKARTDIFFW